MNIPFLFFFIFPLKWKGMLLLVTSGPVTLTFLPERNVFVAQCLSPGVGGTAFVYALLIRQCKYEEEKEGEHILWGRPELINHE